MSKQETIQRGQTEYRILGIEESDGDPCECCGTRCPKRRVVLTDGHTDLRYGVHCAALAVYGDKSYSKTLHRQAKALAFARKTLRAGYGPRDTGTAVWNRFGFTYRVHYDRLQIAINNEWTDVSA
jgi:hypothetical protein